MNVLGAVFLAVAAIMYGFYKSEIVEKRCSVLSECVSLIRHISTQIDYTDEPLQRIMLKAADNNEYKFLAFIKAVADADFANGFDTVWCNNVEKYSKRAFFDSKTVTLLKSLGQKLGKTDSDGQKELCAYYEEQFDLLLNEANEKKAEQVKFYRVIGFAVGLMIFVFVI